MFYTQRKKFSFSAAIVKKDKIILEPTWVRLTEMIKPNITSFTFTILDHHPNQLKDLYIYLSECYQWSAEPHGEPDSCEIVIHKTISGGTIEETWILSECYPHSINFGELSHDSSEIPQIEINWRVGSVKLQGKAPFKKGSVQIIEEF